MGDNMFKKILSKKYYYFCLALAFIALMLTSKNSFLYEFNDWVDANAFFTMGKSMMRGVVPYKELFEQKGIFLYFIYGIGSLLSYNTFHGVFILEVVSFSIFLYYAHKIFSLYLDKKYSLVLLPILTYLITTSLAFMHGGSCEEFALPFLTVTLYYYFKHFKVGELTNKETIVNGVMASLVFLMKYTMIGLFAGFGLTIFISYLIKKEYKKGLMFCLMFLAGFLIPIVPVLIYLGINHAISDFIECYFTINMTAYSDNASSIFRNFRAMPRGIYNTIILNGSIVSFLMFVLPVLTVIINIKENSKSFKENIIFKLGLLSMIFFSILTIYWGLKFYTYYLLPIFVFIIFVLLSISLILKKYIAKIKYKKIIYIGIVIVNILFAFLYYNDANYKNVRVWGKKAFFQFKYAKYINEYKKPTLLNAGFLDGGLYTTSGIVPNTRFFEEQNINYDRYPDNIDSMHNTIKKKKVKFVLFYTQGDMKWIKKYYPELPENYELVFNDKHYFENAAVYNAYLFKLKGLKK